MDYKQRSDYPAGQARSGSPRVSIGLPVYNGEPYIRATLESCLAQTFTNFELIVSDNASTDRTVEIIREYADKDDRIVLVQNEQNRGAAFNYNHVLAQASAPYFKWMAADDIIDPLFLATAVDLLDRHPSVALAYAEAGFIDEEDRILYCFDEVMRLKSWPKATVPRVQKMLSALLADGRAANVIIFGLIRISALRSIRPLGNYFGCDLTLVNDLALLGEIYEMPGVFAFYRRHAKSSSTYEHPLGWWRRRAGGNAVYKQPSAETQQNFLDPSVTGRLRQELQLRRRYYEIFRGIGAAPIRRRDRIRLMTAAAGHLMRRVTWRLRYEFGRTTGPPDEPEVNNTPTYVGLHWQEFALAMRRE